MEGHLVTLIFAGGENRQIVVGPVETVEQAARRQGVRLLTDCREGACGTCKARCLRGDYWLNDYSRDALSDADLESGFVLTCQMCVRSPSVIEFDYPLSDTTAKPAAPFPALVRSVERVSDTVVQLTLESAGGRVSFLPGQYADLAVPDCSATRAYSFANQPNSEELIFYIRLIEGGAMGEYLLRRAQPRDSLTLHGPFGRFFLRAVTRPMLMIAGGTGLAPMLSMLRQLAASAERPAQMLLVYGANRPSDLFGLDELTRLQESLGCLRVVVCVRSSDSQWNGPVGLVSDVAAAQDVDFGSADVYLCGPPLMIEHAEGLLTARGAVRGRLFAERFVPARS